MSLPSHHSWYFYMSVWKKNCIKKEHVKFLFDNSFLMFELLFICSMVSTWSEYSALYTMDLLSLGYYTRLSCSLLAFYTMDLLSLGYYTRLSCSLSAFYTMDLLLIRSYIRLSCSLIKWNLQLAKITLSFPTLTPSLLTHVGRINWPINDIT